MQEKVWLQRLKCHIEICINPVLTQYQSASITLDDVVNLLDSHLHHLVEYEVVTIKHLVVKISQSFAAGILQDTSSDHGMPTANTKPLHTTHDNLLEAPVILLGVLVSSVLQLSKDSPLQYKGLFLADATGKIPCEVG